MTRLIIISILYILLTVYGFQAIKTVFKSSWIHYLFFAIALVVALNMVYQFTTPSEGRVISGGRGYAIGFLLSFMAFNLVLVPILIGEDIIRSFISLYDKYFITKESFYLPSRRKFISQIGLGLAAIPFASLLYGMYQGRYNYKVLKYTLHFEDLPEAFDGYKMTHISDIHSGSFDNKEKINYAVDLVNKQKSDVIVFTGDLVNNKASEMYDWKDTFSRLSANDGVFSVLGNHDYGDYVDWATEKDKQDNLNELITIQKEIGFDLLLNESRYIQKDGQKLALVGVENWGKGGFKKAGDLDKASSNIAAGDFKILLSHDPSHWAEKVIDHDNHYHLTLSGHTHGMQFGIEIPGWIKWSPVKWRYKHWAGIYKEKGQYINVNRGFGYLAYPGRVGIWPEITVIELKKGTQIA
ncbi:MAG: putative MPP superfamily phosphohydrolase [Olleya marilimosa]|jgi:predicted MPP superfamily phosphohydrolase|uniref:metallophosphoesterase n=1 Tax=Olleya marilimosa TaxID=272164 RepID=UPI0030EE66A0|tara:strand:+ start:139112 stop:140341 length:1230 start_codon:yes stop_codon:yes gene_type:complete